MYSTEMIRKFPEAPTRPILFVVYNQDMVEDAESYIAIIHGEDYLTRYCKVVPLATKVENHTHYDVYIDPTVYKYMHSWND